MPEQNQHPEGLPFAPEGLGWDTFDQKVPDSFAKVSLLTDANIAAVRRNHPIEWEAAITAVNEVMPTPKRDPRTGRLANGASTDEQRRLAALSILIEHGVVGEQPPKEKEVQPT